MSSSDPHDERDRLLRLRLNETRQYPDPFDVIHSMLYNHVFVPGGESAHWSEVWYERPTKEDAPEHVVDADPPLRPLLPEAGAVTREIVYEREGEEGEEE